MWTREGYCTIKKKKCTNRERLGSVDTNLQCGSSYRKCWGQFVSEGTRLDQKRKCRKWWGIMTCAQTHNDYTLDEGRTFVIFFKELPSLCRQKK